LEDVVAPGLDGAVSPDPVLLGKVATYVSRKSAVLSHCSASTELATAMSAAA